MVLPAHLIHRLESESKGSLTFHKQLLIFPHVSTENLPEWDSDIVPIFINNPVNGLWEVNKRKKAIAGISFSLIA